MLWVIAYYVVLIAVFITASVKLPSWGYYLFCGVWNAVFVVICILLGDVVGVITNAVLGTFWLWLFWRNRPPGMRRKIAKLVGEKARAVKAKVVAAMPQAKPVFVPVPA